MGIEDTGYREKIDGIDAEITRLFTERMNVAAAIAGYKKLKDLPVFDPEREKQKLEAVAAAVPEEIRPYASLLYSLIFELSRAYQHGIIGSAPEPGEALGPSMPQTRDKKALKCGLIGKKLAHSLSPEIHECLSEVSAEYDYRLFELEDDEVEAFLKTRDFDGLNVTIPYKKTVLPYLDELSDAAREAGSVNTIIKRPDGTLYGDNTDVFGFTGLMKRAGIDPYGKKTLVLGSGGVSVAIVLALRRAGALPVVISRTGENNYGNIGIHSDARIIVNATPVGMYPDEGVSPVDLRFFPALEGVLDTIYNPEKTALIKQAESLGIRCMSGLYMLCAQAKRSAELFTGTEIPDEVTDRILSDIRTADGEEKLRFLVINGPNINMLGIREPDIYGKNDYRELLGFIKNCAREAGVAADCYQSNHEGDIVDKIQEAYGKYDGIIINPAALTHTSVAVLDALKAAGLPAVEVHISDVSAREPFRQISYAGMACVRTYAGYGFDGYRRAVMYLKRYIRWRRRPRNE